MKNYYDILQVNPKASPEIIEKAYHFLAKKYHPDMQSDEIEKLRCEQILKDLNEAYYVLSDVFLREQYDKELQNQNIQNINNQKNINTTNRQENIENRSNVHNNSKDKIDFSNFKNNFKTNKRKNKKQENKKNVQQNQEPERYEVGTFSALVAIVKRLIQDSPDTENIKKINKKDIYIFIIAIVIVLIICVILWFIPFTNSFIRNIFFLK